MPRTDEPVVFNHLIDTLSDQHSGVSPSRPLSNPRGRVLRCSPGQAASGCTHCGGFRWSPPRCGIRKGLLGRELPLRPLTRGSRWINELAGHNNIPPMAVPDYQSTMLPLLEYVSDGKPHPNRDVVEALATTFKLTEEEKNEMLPSGVQQTFYNRVMWARFHLVKAGMLISPSRGTMQITERGLQELKTKPSKINIAYLKKFNEFNDFLSSIAKRNPSGSNESPEESSQTPEEILDSSYIQIRAALSQELLSKVQSLTWMDFERLVVQLLVRMGYGGSVKDAGRALAKSGDEGIDGTIKEDKLGLDVIYIQAKKWQTGNTVGRPEIQKFVGALAGQGAKKGIFITTSGFSSEARSYQPRNETKIVLIDGEELTQLMIDHDLGVTPQRTYTVKRIDSDFFGEE
ncbi:MAG: restriction endonuclease [Flavobacteriales bacterium]